MFGGSTLASLESLNPKEREETPRQGRRPRLSGLGGPVLSCFALQCFEHPVNFVLGVVMDESDAEKAAVLLHA